MITVTDIFRIKNAVIIPRQRDIAGMVKTGKLHMKIV